MAFHPYPQVIRILFNVYRFGPPSPVTETSACSRVDHLVSRLLMLTIAPCEDSLSLRLTCLKKHLTSPTKATRRFIMQKARRHTSKKIIRRAPTACRHMVSGSISLLCSRSFSPFPHGTGTLSVSGEYLALADGPAGFVQDFSCPALLRIANRYSNVDSCTGLSPSMIKLSRMFHFNVGKPKRSVLQPRQCRNIAGLG